MYLVGVVAGWACEHDTACAYRRSSMPRVKGGVKVVHPYIW